jgi:hypothetical protein
MGEDQRVSKETLSKYYYALTDIINEYLHSFRTPENLTKMVPQETIDYLRNRSMEDLKHILDIEAYRLVEGQKKMAFGVKNDG